MERGCSENAHKRKVEQNVGWNHIYIVEYHVVLQQLGTVHDAARHMHNSWALSRFLPMAIKR